LHGEDCSCMHQSPHYATKANTCQEPHDKPPPWLLNNDVLEAENN
jgi:hypothetical protein